MIENLLIQQAREFGNGKVGFAGAFLYEQWEKLASTLKNDGSVSWILGIDATGQRQGQKGRETAFTIRYTHEAQPWLVSSTSWHTTPQNAYIEMAGALSAKNGAVVLSDDSVDAPYDKDDMDTAIAYGRISQKLFKAGFVEAAHAHYLADPNGGALPEFRQTTLSEFVFRMQSLSGGSAASTYLSPAERQAWSESGAADEEIEMIARAGGYAAILASTEKQLRLQDILDHVMHTRILAIRNALRDKGWEEAPVPKIRSAFMPRNVQGGFMVKPGTGNIANVSCGFKTTHIGHGRNVVGFEFMTWCEKRGIVNLPDEMTKSAAEMADLIDTALAPPAESRTMEEGMRVVYAIAGDLRASLSEWRDSGENWKYASLTADDTVVPIGVSTGGVVSVNGDPFTPEERVMNVTKEAVMTSVTAYMNRGRSPYEIAARAAGFEVVPDENGGGLWLYRRKDYPDYSSDTGIYPSAAEGWQACCEENDIKVDVSDKPIPNRAPRMRM